MVSLCVWKINVLFICFDLFWYIRPLAPITNFSRKANILLDERDRSAPSGASLLTYLAKNILLIFPFSGFGAGWGLPATSESWPGSGEPAGRIPGKPAGAVSTTALQRY